MVERALKSAPSQIQVFDRQGDLSLDLGGGSVYFDPGSVALTVLDRQSGEIRSPTSQDCVEMALLTDALPQMDAQSTAIIPGDVPESIADRYRLFVALLFCGKPVVTGAFTRDGVEPMAQMLSAVRGSKEALRQKPLAIFDACPSPPLTWSEQTTQNLLDCARWGIPVELVSMPMSGANAPITLEGTLIQHTAESLSGLVLAQLSSPGTPVVYGGAPAIMDMRQGTTPMGAIETMMIDGGYAQIARHLELPSHGYMGLSDSKCLDVQAGLESALGAVMGGLCGLSLISGPGMLSFVSTQSLEKLYMDNDICGMVRRLLEGIEPGEPFFARRVLADLLGGEAGHLLGHASTLERFRQEFYYPKATIDRNDGPSWERKGKEEAQQRVRKQVERLLTKAQPCLPSREVTAALWQMIEDEAQGAGLMQLPLQRDDYEV